jgi:ABC-type glycerol-3-phosphate transport system substrate-binding protein
MRSFLVVSAAALGLSACAGQPAPAAAAPKALRCWNGDAGKFMDVGSQASISGVPVNCEKTSDGKSAQWMGQR